jgi:hypothetical protein
MSLESQLATEPLEARLAEELEERTEFCDWVSICCTCCGSSCKSTPTTCTNSATCSVSGT